ncbi:MAG: tetratricopeptide repeat protein [Candidatus Omnitrophica bacterium]|nr:tetratricopeptide repeat protein [Candidatus Omnitrophota bacterium]
MTTRERFNKFLSSDAAVIGLLAVIGILIYINCLPNEMFWDDDDFILNNRYIQDWAFWREMVTQNIIAGAGLISNYWRPLLSSLFSLAWHIWGAWTPGWHALSISCHIAASIPLFFLIEMLFKNRLLALLSACMFLVHPAQTEAVVYANALGDPLAAIFVFWGLVFFLRFRLSGKSMLASRNWWLALLFYPLALLSKETGILFVAFAILCDWMILPTTKIFRQRLITTARAVWPFVLIALTYLLLRAKVFNFANSFNFYHDANAFTSSLGMRLAVFFQSLATYAGILFMPCDLRVERMVQPPETFLTSTTALGALIFAGLILAAWHWRKTRPEVTFGILWFFVALAPTSNILVVINAIIYEHFLYTALIGIWLAVFCLLLQWAATPQRKRIISVGIVALFVAFSVRVIWRNTDWRSAIGFYEKLTLTAPKSYRVLNNLGMEYNEKGLNAEAEATYAKAIALDPTNAVAYHNLARVCYETGRTEQAIANYEKAIALQPNFLFSYQPLARLYWEIGDQERARALMNRLRELAR